MENNLSKNGFQTSYANDRSTASNIGSCDNESSDPASSSFFSTDFKRHDDLKQMLDSNKDNSKLEAMKRIIGMIAKGKDASDLFPAVVKNVVSKNVEIKKLVYVYLTRYAEEQQDLALLSISTFQRALKDPNQLIRASALRVLSSIRVTMIVPIMMLAIKESVMDMSPYVRKTAAHAIPKLYNLDYEQKDILIEVIEKLLGDKTTLVAGSAIQAFEEVCPERIDLIHKHYRKLCNLLADVEEWGQVVIINMLTRYVRTQFLNPNNDDTLNSEGSDGKFYDSSDSENESSKYKKKQYIMDVDHKLLLKASKPLLNSRNSSVVMAVSQLYYHCAPKLEVSVVAKALVRLLKSHKEVQYVVLSNIAAMTIERKNLFESYLKSFYVHSNDPTHVKLLKLEILTNLATETSISTILREFHTYVTSSDQEFAAATIHAIGRCASNISEITDTCLNGLLSLLSNRNEHVVGESVIVIKKLLQMQPSAHKDIIIQMAKILESITVPMARASILWLIGEYSDRVPKIAPDVLRVAVKNFINEDGIVKLQILNLAAKLCLSNAKQTKLLCQYVFSLAKYDQCYDIRDRTRYLKALVLPIDQPSLLSKYVKKICLCSKPAPILESQFKNRDKFQLGTLSHMINQQASGYHDLPDWPTIQPDRNVRDVEITPSTINVNRSRKIKEKKVFYSESEGSTEGADSEISDEEEDDDDLEEDEEETEEASSEEISDENNSDENDIPTMIQKHNNSKINLPQKVIDSEEESTDETSSENDDNDEDDSSIDESMVSLNKSNVENINKNKNIPPEAVNLLDLNFDNMNTSFTHENKTFKPDILQPTSGIMAPINEKGFATKNTVHVQIEQPYYELISKMKGDGLKVDYRFTRTLSAFSPKCISIELIFKNTTQKNFENVHMSDKKLSPGVSLEDFPPISMIAANSTTTTYLYINFNDSKQSASFVIVCGEKKHYVSLTAPLGELLIPNTMTDNDFKKTISKLIGMNESSSTIDLPMNKSSSYDICHSVLKAANVLQVPCTNENVYQFSSKTVTKGDDTLIQIIKKENSRALIKVNSENIALGNMLLQDLKKSLLSN